MTHSNPLSLQKQDAIPDYLVYEVINHQPFFYSGYEEILRKTKTLEAIVGSSALQALIISSILRFLYKHLAEEAYEIVTNEAELHIDKGDNLATDIAIYATQQLKTEKIDDKYFKIAPKIVGILHHTQK